MIDSKEASILRGLAVFGAAWQVLWLVTESGLRTVVAADPVSVPVIALAVSGAAWVALWPSIFGPWRSARRTVALQMLVIAAVFIAGIVLIADRSAIGADGWFVGASVINLAAGLTGLYVSGRGGVAIVVGMVIIETIVVSIVHSEGFDTYPLSVDLVYPLYALALGLASAASRRALLASARVEDRSGAELARQQSARATTESADASLSVAETRLHETVLNTLTAIVRGGLADDASTSQRLRERASEAADVLESIAAGSDAATRWAGDLGADLANVITDLRDSGVRVRIEGVLGPTSEVTDAYRAMGSAVREALINVYRHANARTVRIEATVTKRSGRTMWLVQVVDDGVGVGDAVLGYGLRSVVTEGLQTVGGRVRIESGLEGGTSVTLEVPMPEARAQQGSVVGPLRAIGGPVLVAFTAFSLFVIGATWEFTRVPLANLGAVAVFAVMVVVLASVIFPGGSLSRAEPRYAPWWVVIVVIVGVPIMTRIEVLAEAIANPTGDWSSEAASALLFIVVATGPWWAGPVALVSWFGAQGDVLVELTRPGTIVIVVAAILGWSLRRADQRTRQLRADADAERTALAASQQRLSEVRRRYADVDTQGLVDLLRALAAGRLDPRDAHVRNACVRQERLIRSVLPLHPERNRVHRDLVQLAVVAQENDVDLSISATDEGPADKGLSRLDCAVSLVELASPGSAARVSMDTHDGACVFRLVVSVEVGNLSRIPEGAEVLDEDPDGGRAMVAYEESCDIATDAQRSASDTRSAAGAGA